MKPKKGRKCPQSHIEIEINKMRWNRWTLQPFLDVRIAVRNKTLAASFKRLYPDFQTDNDTHAVRLAA